MKVAYSNELHDQSAERTISSARAIAPLVYNVVKPNSVIDIGCGHGHWLREFQLLGTRVIHGIDGDYISKDSLAISPSSFTAYDLNSPLKVESHYDLAISIEVAEHLNPKSSDHFVESLCKLSNIILFSAAIPGQPGHCHINANWPDFWANRFGQHGYIGFDFIRPKIWHKEELLLCHRQNIVMYVHQSIAHNDIWNTIPKLNCLTLIDVDTIKSLLTLRESTKRIIKRIFG